VQDGPAADVAAADILRSHPRQQEVGHPGWPVPYRLVQRSKGARVDQAELFGRHLLQQGPHDRFVAPGQVECRESANVDFADFLLAHFVGEFLYQGFTSRWRCDVERRPVEEVDV
jgi:hypothetical protein